MYTLLTITLDLKELLAPGLKWLDEVITFEFYCDILFLITTSLLGKQ